MKKIYLNLPLYAKPDDWAHNPSGLRSMQQRSPPRYLLPRFCRKRQLQENERDARASERLRAPDWQCPNLVTQSPAVEIHFQPGAPILTFYTYRLALHPPLRAKIRRFAFAICAGTLLRSADKLPLSQPQRSKRQG